MKRGTFFCIILALCIMLGLWIPISAQTDKIDALILRYGSTSQMLKTGAAIRQDVGEIEFGLFESDKATGSLRLLYAGDNRGTYRFMPKFKDKNGYDVAYGYMRVTYLVDSPLAYSLYIHDNGSGGKLCLDDHTGRSDGKFVQTAPISIAGTVYAERFAKGAHCTLGFDIPTEDAAVYVKEIAFFKTESDAYAYYGDSASSYVSVQAMTFGTYATGFVREAFEDRFDLGTNDKGVRIWDHGLFVHNEDAGTVQLLYAPSWKSGKAQPYHFGSYRMMVGFQTADTVDATYDYARILYCAKPADAETEPVMLRYMNNGDFNDFILFEDDVQDTHGEYILSPTAAVSDKTATRISKKNAHMTVEFTADHDGGEFFVKGLYFFRTKEEADAFTVQDEYAQLSVNGKDLSDYRIVIGAKAEKKTVELATLLQTGIQAVGGYRLAIVTDDTESNGKEIILGNTARSESAVYYQAPNGKFFGENGTSMYCMELSDDNVVIAAGSQFGLEKAVNYVLGTWLQIDSNVGIKHLDITDAYEVPSGSVSYLYHTYPDPEERDATTYFDDFESETDEPDYWIEYANVDQWSVENGAYVGKSDKISNTWLHIFERDVEYTVKMTFPEIGDKGMAGMLLRFNGDDAFIRVGYDLKKGEWFIENRQGTDFNLYRLATYQADFASNETVTVKAVLTGTVLKVYLNGEGNAVLETDLIAHTTPGKVGLFCEDTQVVFDDCDFVFTTGQGRLQKGVADLAFGPRETDVIPNGGAGGTIVELKDGSLQYLKKNYISADNGITWEPGGSIAGVNISCASVFRLQSGKLIQMKKVTVDGKAYHISQTSEDDGKTWVDGGIIAAIDYKGYGTMLGVNQNDKFTQMSDGRIFVSQNYEGTIPSGEPNAHCKVFVEIYYSDDEGKTWTKSEDDSFDVYDGAYFGESKVLEGADGQLVWLTTWQKEGYVLYSVSKDKGVTWSKTEMNTDFPMSHSSYGSMTDPYADTLTHYMVTVANSGALVVGNNQRSRLGLYRSYDGVHWEFLADVDRWEDPMTYGAMAIHHYVNPFITVTEDYIYVGSGRSDAILEGGYHQLQRQFILRFDKAELTAYETWPSYQ